MWDIILFFVRVIFFDIEVRFLSISNIVEEEMEFVRRVKFVFIVLIY